MGGCSDSGEPRTPRRKRKGLAASLVLLLVGAVLLWQGSSGHEGRRGPGDAPTVAADRPQEKRGAATRRQASEEPRVRLPPGRTFADGGTIGRVEIPSVGVNAPMIELGLNPDESLKVPGDPEKTGWWKGGAKPGERGAAVIVGHVDSLRGAAVFHDLRRLADGDRVTITNDDGSSASYVVTGRERVPKNSFPTDRVYDETSKATIRLVTCGGRFDKRRGHYRDNLIVYGKKA